MNRRHLLLCTSALALTLVASPGLAESNVVEYTRQAYEQALASGKPFMLDFFADW